MPPELASLSMGARYRILPDHELSLLNSFIRLLQRPDEDFVELILQDPDGRETLRVQLVRLTEAPEEDRHRGVVHFGGILSDGRRIRGHFSTQANHNPAEPIGSAIVRF
jgi:hypothetical protein